MGMPLAWTTAGRPPLPQVGLVGWNRDLNALEVWNGSAWSAVGGGAACLDGVILTDPGPAVALPPAPGTQIPLGGGPGDVNLDPTNYGIGTVVAGALTILNDGDYLLEAEVVVIDAGVPPYFVQTFVQTTPSGLGTWANLPQADAFGEIVTPGAIVTLATMRAILQISGGGGLDVQVVGQNNGGGPPFPNTLGTDSRLRVSRLC